jgi:alpha-1,3-mannosyltransferase
MIDIPLLLFTSNLIGITAARSLHYQFHSWYFHQIPFLLVVGGAWNSVVLGYVSRLNIPSLPNPSPSSIDPSVDMKGKWLIFRAVLWTMIEYGWATFPSTNLSSGLLFLAHIIMLGGLLFVNKPHAIQIPSLSGKKLKQK